MSYLTDCVMGKGRGQAGVCFGCAGELPKGRRRWCGDECRVEFEGNHYWNVARWVALRLAGDDRREVGARCARCGGDGRIPRGSCSCFASWPCPREGEPLYTYAGQGVAAHGTARSTEAAKRPGFLLPLGLDSHRYRCCGNGVVSNVSEWIGVRLARAVELVGERAACWVDGSGTAGDRRLIDYVDALIQTTLERYP